MSEGQLSRLDLAAMFLLLIGFLVAVSVYSQDPAEAGADTIYPPRFEASNLLGLPGARLACRLQDALGVAVHVFLAQWFVLVMVLLRRPGWLRGSARLVGWSLLVPCLAVLADRIGPERLGGPVSGSGGTLGAWLSGLLRGSLPWWADHAILAGILLLSLSLALGFVLSWLFGPVRWLATLLNRSGRLLLRHGRFRKGTRPHRRRTTDAADDIPIVYHGNPAAAIEPLPRPGPIPIIRPAAMTDLDRFADYQLPPLSLLEDAQPFPYEEHDQYLRAQALVLEQTFTDFGLKVRVVGINSGPVITQYEVTLETGLRLNKVTRLADDLALNLKVPSVRMVAPIPGKNTVGIEIPNEHRAVVRLKEVMQLAGKRVAKMRIPLFLGKDTEGRPLVYDLAEMPHLLIAGRTGTGKSVCMNAIILSMLMTRRPDEVKMIMIDPKMLELSEYGKLPHLMHPIVKDMKKAEAILSWAVDKMEERYDLLSRARVRSIAAYNELSHEEILRRVNPVDDEDRQRIPPHIPYIVIFVDEMGDLMMMMKKEVEGHIIRLAQKSRAAGIHLVVATQKPTVDVITGLIKSNLPARICFQVSSRSDSRVVLDEIGADKLLGKGDMLFLQPGTSTLIRAQGAFAGDEEITRVVEYLECEPCFAPELVQLSTTGKDSNNWLDRLRERDEVYESAIEIVIREGRGSVSLLQRALGIGYGRAARLIDYMAEDGIVGGYNGSAAREVLYTPEQWEQLKASASCPSR